MDPFNTFEEPRQRGIAAGKVPCPKAPLAFRSDDELLETAARLFSARSALAEAERIGDATRQKIDPLRKEEAQWSRHWHRSFRLSPASLMLCQQAKRFRLNETEREIVAALVLDQLAMLPERVACAADILRLVTRPGTRMLRAVRTLSEHGRLYSAGLITFDDPDEDLPRRKPVIDPALVDAVLARQGKNEAAFGVGSEAELLDRMAALTRTLMRKSDLMQNLLQGYGSAAEVFKLGRKAERLLRKFHETLDLHPAWKLAALRKQSPLRAAQIMLMVLMGKRLGHLPPNEPLFTGGGLARAAAESLDGVAENLRLLTADFALVADGLVRPCGGDIEFASSDAGELEQTEFELTEKAVELLGIPKRSVKARFGEFLPRKPSIRLEQIVLSDDIRQALDLAMVHARHGARMLDDWGLGELIPYGRGPALLFSGPPGTGKTAAAEGLAHELGKLILVADYSRIQNCFVGQTEKNIVRAFREAREQDAVLLWDEADAMFYDRDSASRNWEVRDVNVLLQQLEQFEGVCILATNRKITLDKALERRITLKVEFHRPDCGQRLQIWRKFLPAKMPLESGLDVEELGRLDLSGGEIKNVVLNAARLALRRSPQGPVTMADFQQALSMEEQGKWGVGRGRIGFGQ